jgi:hypothetical protein
VMALTRTVCEQRSHHTILLLFFVFLIFVRKFLAAYPIERQGIRSSNLAVRLFKKKKLVGPSFESNRSRGFPCISGMPQGRNSTLLGFPPMAK